MAWDSEAFSRSLGGQSPATQSAYRGDLRAFITWAERAVGGGPRRCRPRAAAPLSGVSHHASLCPDHGGAQGRRAAVLLRLAAPARGLGGRPRPPPSLARGALAPAEGARARRSRGHAGRHEPGGRRPGTARALGGDVAGVGRRTGVRDDAVLELLYGCGLRVAELCGLDIGDLDMRARTVTVMGKGRRQRRVPMHDRCAQALDLWTSRGRQALVTEVTPPHAVFVNRRVRDWAPETSGESSTAGLRFPRTHMPCATASPRTSSTGVPTCVSSRNFWDTPVSRPPRSTLMSARSGCSRSTERPIPVRRGSR